MNYFWHICSALKEKGIHWESHSWKDDNVTIGASMRSYNFVAEEGNRNGSNSQTKEAVATV